SAQNKKHDDKTKKETKGKSPAESLIGYINLSVEFKYFLDNSINEVNAAGISIPAVGQIFTVSTNTFSAVGPSHAALKQRVKKLEIRNKLKVFKLRRLKKVGTTQRIDTSDDTVMDDISKQGVEVVTIAKLITEVVTVASETITVADIPIPTAIITDSTSILTTVPTAIRRRKGVVIRDPEETSIPSIIIHTEPKSKDIGKGIMVHEPKPLKKKT
nr:hypothetical protein [Tanacetum cinerariifolium]